MNSAVIVCNGEFPKKEYPLYLLGAADVVICCDSRDNVRRLARLGITPTLIVGDMDSTPKRVQTLYGDRLVHIAEQDDNDMAKAFRTVLQRWPEISDITILGAGGKSSAHTVGNLGWLMEWERMAMDGQIPRGLKVQMVSDYDTAFAISDATDLHVGEGRKLSFFSTDPSLRIQSKGLRWPLDGVDLSRWWAATLNVAGQDIVSLSFNHPAPLLVILD